jgi:ribonucleoside-diphosphate reductase alpha chain
MKMRNATCTSIAPTGTIAIIAGTSPSIEPIFDIVYKRHAYFGTLTEYNSLLTKVKDKKLFITAHKVPKEYHVKIQAAFQKYTDNAVSKTVNIPEKAKVSDIKKTFILAYKLGCKGLTVYRHKSKPKQVLNFCTKCRSSSS